MIQDIFPHILRNEFTDKTGPREYDKVLIFRENKVLVKAGAVLSYPEFGELRKNNMAGRCRYRYILKMDEQEIYLGMSEKEIELPGYSFESTQLFRSAEPMELAYAGVTAWHLYQWYRDNRYCGRCGGELVHDHKERMLSCPVCHRQVYPGISPSVIVAVTDGSRLLVTRYAANRNYRKYALVAGFTEIGETAEQTVAREVMEETGLRVKNIRYYKSQPWGFSGGLLLGYWAELDGDDTIHLDTEELCEGKWVTPEELELDSLTISLTREMMGLFKEGKFGLTV